MSLQGHVDIAWLDNWHKNLSYTLHDKPLSGFMLVDLDDYQRYNQPYINVEVCQDIGIGAEEFFTRQFNFLQFPKFSIQRLRPGMMLPMHSDRYGFFKTQCPETSIDSIIRVIVFLENWQSGHISEVGQRPHTDYKAGFWMSWTGYTPHLAANLGHTDRYTLQITGIMNQKPLQL